MTDTTDTPVQGTGLDGAATAIEALMTTDEPVIPDTPKPEEEAPKASTEEVDALNGENPDDETPEGEEGLLGDEPEEGEPETPEGEEGEAAAETEDDNEAEEEPEAELHTVKINGKEEQISLDEALQGYQRQSDYTRKSQALADERKAFATEQTEFAEEAEAVKVERAQYAELLTALAQQVRSEMEQEPDWDKLFQENPAEFTRQRAAFDDNRRRLEAAQSELARVQQQQQAENQKELQKRIKAEKAKLIEAVPEWKDPKKFDADRKAIREFGTSIGFTEEELSSTFDHRAVLALRMAARYHAMSKNPPKAKPGKGPKAAKPGAATQQPGAKSKRNAAIKRLEKSGSREDAAAVFETLL